MNVPVCVPEKARRWLSNVTSECSMFASYIWDQICGNSREFETFCHGDVIVHVRATRINGERVTEFAIDLMEKVEYGEHNGEFRRWWTRRDLFDAVVALKRASYWLESI